MKKIIVSVLALSSFSTAHAGMLVDRDTATALVAEKVEGGVNLALCTGIKEGDLQSPSAVVNNSSCAAVNNKPLNEKLFARSRTLKKTMAKMKSDIQKENAELFKKAEQSLVTAKGFGQNTDFFDLANAVQALQIDEKIMLKKRLTIADYSSPFQYAKSLTEFAESSQIEDSTIARMVNLANTLDVVSR